MFFATISDFKDTIEAALHLSRDALHVHIGLVIFLGVAALLSGPRRFQIAFVALLGLCFLNEMADLSNALEKGWTFTWLGSGKDVVNTMFWPAVWLAAGPQILRLLRDGRSRHGGLPVQRRVPGSTPPVR